MYNDVATHIIPSLHISYLRHTTELLSAPLVAIGFSHAKDQEGVHFCSSVFQKHKTNSLDFVRSCVDIEAHQPAHVYAVTNLCSVQQCLIWSFGNVR